MVNLEDIGLGAEEGVLPHGSVLLPESPGPWQLQSHLCPRVTVTCHSSRLGSLSSMALWTNLVPGKVFFAFGGGVFIPQKT